MKKILNGTVIDMTQEEIKQHEEDVKNVEVEIKNYNDEKKLKEENKNSGKLKLKNLGLNDAEIKALIGA
tara:strand:+ start:587 stop:793 length:207 start_codon:yes stop_codon:yes gene_type:complete